MISDLTLNEKAKQLVDAVEKAGVLAKGADRLSCEQLARYFIRAFKNKQLGVETEGIKSSLGTELQALTESQVFRFPSTFTFIFRAVASLDGIGKGLDDGYDLGEFAQPFVERLIDRVKYGGDETRKALSIFSKATGLNAADVNTALQSPRKVAYRVQETPRKPGVFRLWRPVSRSIWVRFALLPWDRVSTRPRDRDTKIARIDSYKVTLKRS